MMYLVDDPFPLELPHRLGYQYLQHNFSIYALPDPP